MRDEPAAEMGMEAILAEGRIDAALADLRETELRCRHMHPSDCLCARPGRPHPPQPHRRGHHMSFQAGTTIVNLLQGAAIVLLALECGSLRRRIKNLEHTAGEDT